MTDYCSLHIRADTLSELPKDFLSARNDVEIIFTDNESPERRASFERMARKGVFRRVALPRYHWTFSSEGFVKGCDLYDHIGWVLDQIRPGILLSQLQTLGFECLLQFYWEGNGTGGGPLVTPQISQLLVRHDVSLQFGFYLKSEES